jgi:hypothetical protein
VTIFLFDSNPTFFSAASTFRCLLKDLQNHLRRGGRRLDIPWERDAHFTEEIGKRDKLIDESNEKFKKLERRTGKASTYY